MLSDPIIPNEIPVIFVVALDSTPNRFDKMNPLELNRKRVPNITPKNV